MLCQKKKMCFNNYDKMNRFNEKFLLQRKFSKNCLHLNIFIEISILFYYFLESKMQNSF